MLVWSGAEPLLAVATGHSLVYANHQKQLADKHLELAELAAAKAEEAMVRLEEALLEADMQRKIAQHHMVLLAEQRRGNSTR